MVSRAAGSGVAAFQRVARLVVAALVVAVALGGCASGPRSPAPEATTTSVTGAGDTSAPVDPRRACTVRALGVLDRWDRARATAYADGDAANLRRLYAARSRAGAADVRVLRRYAERGLAVTRMRRQVLDAHARSCTPTRLRLRVTDRLVGARVEGAGFRRRLPGTQVRRWLLTLERTGRGWVLARVVDP